MLIDFDNHRQVYCTQIQQGLTTGATTNVTDVVPLMERMLIIIIFFNDKLTIATHYKT